MRHVAADAAALPAAQPKPTSLTGQVESALAVWQSAAPTSAGIWECDPGEFTAARPDLTEVCQILSGSGTVTGEDGVSAEIGPGSLLVLPLGWRGTWVVREKIRKTYVLIGGAATV
ncbi:DUF861 domain-containing protein [Planosporangium thailandense]|uniref:DUF861 domain-containing protein n=1 Tax=Planosporangium thailandense TaxID=765197 RepID=A0ABX0Y6A3_9ACTN|nr:DUF861 domain-containing protein [Planosporangium thailandense]